MLNMWITTIIYFHCGSDEGGYTGYKVGIQVESEDKDMRRGMITSIDPVPQVSTKFQKKKDQNKKTVLNIEHNTKDTRENGDKCVRKWKRKEMRMHVYIHAGIRIMNMQIEKGDRHKSRVVHTSRTL